MQSSIKRSLSEREKRTRSAPSSAKSHPCPPPVHTTSTPTQSRVDISQLKPRMIIIYWPTAPHLRSHSPSRKALGIKEEEMRGLTSKPA